MTKTLHRAWRRLSRGDIIRCPGDGQLERVTFARDAGEGRWHVRTERHDHIRPRAETVRAVPREA